MQLSPLQQKVLDQIKINPTLNNKQYADIVGSTAKAVGGAMMKMRGKGILPKVERKGVRANLSILDGYKEKHSALNAECEAKGIPIEDVNHYWHKGENFSIHVKGKQVSYFEIRDRIVADMKSHSPKYSPVKYTKKGEGHLLVINPADIHIGKLCSSFETGEDYNNQVAVARVREGVHGILDKSNGFHADKILFVIGNDILHIDTPRSTTTSGTSQDTDGMWSL